MEQEIFNNRYKIIAKIGTGGMADVYKAVDTVLDRAVAIKVLHRHFAEDQDFVSRFRREAQAAASLNHPNIVNIYDWGSQNGTYFIAMELLEGQSLKKYISTSGTIPPVEAMEIIKKVLSALAFAHKHEIIHRDIKPHNIILTSEGEVKVTDFGIARAGASTMTQTGTILGTAHYLSPEQARGQNVGITSDIYSVGVVLYEMVAGRIPFDGENPVAIALKHVNDAPLNPRELNPDIPQALQVIIDKAMAKNPESRYRNANEMRSDIIRAIEGVPIMATIPDEQKTVVMAPSGKAARAGRPKTAFRDEPPRRARKNGLLVVIMAILLLAVMGAGGWLAASSGVFGQKMVSVPDVTSMTMEDARETLRLSKLKLKEAGKETSDKIAEGSVTRQSPASGERLKEGSAVEVYISSGKGKIAIPDVNGQKLSRAKAILRDAGFEVDDTVDEYSELDKGLAIGTDPPADDEVPPGTRVDIIVSGGPKPVQVPDVYKTSAEEAKSILEKAGFKANITEDFSDVIQKGYVIKTTPPGGVGAPEGSTVNVYVSKGEKMLTVPDVRGKLEDEATDILVNAGFEVDVGEYEGVTPNLDSRVMSQNPFGNTLVKERDAKVTIYVGRSF